MAKNLLIEEYPRAKDFITAHKGDHNIFNINHMAAQKDGIKMGSFSLIHSTSSTMKTTKTTRNRMSRRR